MSAPAIFLDRDGVIIENRPDYVRSWEQVEIFDRSLGALAAIRDSPHKIFIVTNQSVVGRGLIPHLTAEEINTRLVRAIKARGGRIDHVYMCPHAPAAGCRCRKPRPGMLLEAAAQHGIDLESSILIGDALTDLEAAWRAGLQTVGLVRTGRGRGQALRPRVRSLPPFPVFEDLSEALESLLGKAGGSKA